MGRGCTAAPTNQNLINVQEPFGEERKKYLARVPNEVIPQPPKALCSHRSFAGTTGGASRGTVQKHAWARTLALLFCLHCSSKASLAMLRKQPVRNTGQLFTSTQIAYKSPKMRGRKQRWRRGSVQGENLFLVRTATAADEAAFYGQQEPVLFTPSRAITRPHLI